jgi:hypothetical protein
MPAGRSRGRPDGQRTTGVPMKCLMLALPLIVSACGDDVEARLAKCRDDIRAELTDLVDRTKRDTAESLKAIEALRPTGSPHGRESAESTGTLGDDLIKAIPEMLAAAVPMIEAQLKAFEPTPAGLAQCQSVLAQTRQG